MVSIIDTARGEKNGANYNIYVDNGRGRYFFAITRMVLRIKKG